MIMILKNYPSVVDAKAWVVKTDLATLVAESKEAMEKAKNSEIMVLPNSVLNNNKSIIGVTFDDAEGALKSMYDFSWENCVQYGDLMLVGNREEMIRIPAGYHVFLWMKNERGTQMTVIFDFKKYMIHDDSRRSHQKGKCLVNYCKGNPRPDKRDASTLTIISMMKEDDNLLEKDVLYPILSDPEDTMFSSLM